MTPEEREKVMAHFTSVEALATRFADERDTLMELLCAAMAIEPGDLQTWASWRALVLSVMGSMVGQRPHG